ncbi:MAG TPA: hypothetical protein VKD19_13385 [Pseudolabrys sp.]|jgi:hypothetical protein|nr:hypothetical protein [Pseudolabrys sp.]
MLKPDFLNGTTSVIRQVAGLELAYQLRGKSAEQRAVLAVAEFDDVAWALAELTDGQRCALFGFSRYQLNQAAPTRRGMRLINTLD